MATRCIDISENKKLGHTSPIAMAVFVALFVVISALVPAGIMFFILVSISFILTQIFFQYSPRFIFLSIKYLLRNPYLTPSFEDKEVVYDEGSIKNIKKILPELEQE
jgi:hypothetical protein